MPCVVTVTIITLLYCKTSCQTQTFSLSKFPWHNSFQTIMTTAFVFQSQAVSKLTRRTRSNSESRQPLPIKSCISANTDKHYASLLIDIDSKQSLPLSRCFKRLTLSSFVLLTIMFSLARTFWLPQDTLPPTSRHKAFFLVRIAF